MQEFLLNSEFLLREHMVQRAEDMDTSIRRRCRQQTACGPHHGGTTGGIGLGKRSIREMEVVASNVGGPPQPMAGEREDEGWDDEH